VIKEYKRKGNQRFMKKLSLLSGKYITPVDLKNPAVFKC